MINAIVKDLLKNASYTSDYIQRMFAVAPDVVNIMLSVKIDWVQVSCFRNIAVKKYRISMIIRWFLSSQGQTTNHLSLMVMVVVVYVCACVHACMHVCVCVCVLLQYCDCLSSYNLV